MRQDLVVYTPASFTRGNCFSLLVCSDLEETVGQLHEKRGYGGELMPLVVGVSILIETDQSSANFRFKFLYKF